MLSAVNQESTAKPIRVTFDTTRLDSVADITVNGDSFSIKQIIRDALNICKQVFQNALYVNREIDNIILRPNTANVG